MPFKPSMKCPCEAVGPVALPKRLCPRDAKKPPVKWICAGRAWPDIRTAFPLVNSSKTRLIGLRRKGCKSGPEAGRERAYGREAGGIGEPACKTCARAEDCPAELRARNAGSTSARRF